MKKESCPDVLTIQALLDGEDSSEEVSAHLEQCSGCRKKKLELQELIALAERLASGARLSPELRAAIVKGPVSAGIPSAVLAAAIFILVLASAFFLEPDFLSWWLSVGMTRQISIVVDLFLSLVFIGRELGPESMFFLLAPLVALEVFLLNRIRKVEGVRKC